MLLRESDQIVSRKEKYIVMMIKLLWDIRLKDNLIVKLFVFFVFYYFDDIIFKNSENKCIYESLNTYLVKMIQVIGNDFCLKILAEFTLYMCVDIVVSFVWLDHHYWLIWYI